MLVLTLFAVCVLVPGDPPPARACAPTIADDKALKALDAWLKLYRAGKVDYLSKNPIKESLAIKFGLLPKNGLGDATWAGDLSAILDAVAKLDDAEAAASLLDVAAIGLDAGKYDYAMAPGLVRAAGEEALAKLSTTAAKDEIARAARGERKADKGMVVALQAAGVRCLGRFKDRTMRTTIEGLLADNDEIVRANAAEALATLGDDEAALALIGALERETSDSVLTTVANSLRSLFAKHLKNDKAAPAAAEKGDAAGAQAEAAVPESVRLAVRTAIKALGRSTWRADMAIVRLLDEFRSAETVPALIAVLERFRDHPEEVKSGKLSGLLQYQAHDLLVAMTGAVFPADQPDKWRELWERDKDSIKVTEKHEPKGPPSTVSGGFCGIPVQGTRVVFVLDLSGSMDWPCAGNTAKDAPSGLKYAQQELRRAMDAIAPNAQFTLVTFNGDAKAEVWSKEMVTASDKNRQKFLKHVDGLRALGGTNLWGGLEETLKIKSLTYGSRYDSNVDEVFILSDGAPSVGDVIDPLEILRMVKDANRFANVRINTVFLNTVKPANVNVAPMDHMTITAAELMKRIAEQNGGKFKEL